MVTSPASTRRRSPSRCVAQQQRPVRVDAGILAADDFVRRRSMVTLAPDQRRALLPLARERSEAVLAKALSSTAPSARAAAPRSARDRPRGRRASRSDVARARSSGGKSASSAVQVDADADDDEVDAVGLRFQLGENAASLAAAEQHVVRPLDRRRRHPLPRTPPPPPTPATSASCGAAAGTMRGRSSIDMYRLQAGPRHPCSPEPAAARRLRIGDDHGAFRRPGAPRAEASLLVEPVSALQMSERPSHSVSSVGGDLAFRQPARRCGQPVAAATRRAR